MNKEEVQELVAFAQQLLQRTTNEIFSDLEKITLQGIISDRSYEQITSDKSTKATPDYLRQTISPKLRRKLTAALKKVGVVDANTKIILKKEIVPKLRQAWLREYSGELASDESPQPSLQNLQKGANSSSCPLFQGDGKGSPGAAPNGSPQTPLQRGAQSSGFLFFRGTGGRSNPFTKICPSATTRHLLDMNHN